MPVACLFIFSQEARSAVRGFPEVAGAAKLFLVEKRLDLREVQEGTRSYTKNL